MKFVGGAVLCPSLPVASADVYPEESAVPYYRPVLCALVNGIQKGMYGKRALMSPHFNRRSNYLF